MREDSRDMVSTEDFGTYETAWCPGCGNFPILESVKKALADSGIAPRDVLFVSGIGQAAKAPHYLNANVFNGLHGRALPVATGAALANGRLKVVVESGDGCTYGEGGNHFLAALRRNIDLTVLVHNNQVYGLTKGQASPTSDPGFVTKAQPGGVIAEPFNPVTTAVALHAGFVARGFSGMGDHLAGLIAQAVAAPGFSLVDILQPCVSFNKVNTFAWYRERVSELSPDHDPGDWESALRASLLWGERIPVGVIFRGSRPSFGASLAALADEPLAGRETDRESLAALLDGFA